MERKGKHANSRDEYSEPVSLPYCRLIKFSTSAFSRMTAEAYGILNERLAASPHSRPRCGKIVAMISMVDIAGPEPTSLAAGDVISAGMHHLRWIETVHFRQPVFEESA